MASSGKFYQFSRYINDIGLILNGTHRIVPSKFILLQMPGSGLLSDRVFNDIDSMGSVLNTPIDLSIEDYKTIRKNILNTLMTDYVTQQSNYACGDVNFVSHDIYDGQIYSEVYIHFSNTSSNKRRPYDSTNGLFGGNINSSPSNVTFRAVLVLYDIYKLGSTEPMVEGMPMGLFVLEQSETVKAQTSSSPGTAWSTRICSRFVNSTSIGQTANIATAPSDYSSLTLLLAKLGETITVLNKNHSSREADIMQIKQNLDTFRHANTVNVPYLVGREWYVNGRPVSEIDHSVGDAIAQALTQLREIDDVLTATKISLDEVQQKLSTDDESQWTVLIWLSYLHQGYFQRVWNNRTGALIKINFSISGNYDYEGRVWPDGETPGPWSDVDQYGINYTPQITINGPGIGPGTMTFNNPFIPAEDEEPEPEPEPDPDPDPDDPDNGRN